MNPKNSPSYKTELENSETSFRCRRCIRKDKQRSRGGGFHAKDMEVDPLGERASPRMGNTHEAELKLNTRCSVEPCWEGLEIA